MSYASTSTIKDRIDYTKEDFYDVQAEDKFNSLLTQLEKESRSLIDSYMGDATFSKETGKTAKIEAPSDVTVPLIYPVNDVTKVEYRKHPGDSWNTLDSEDYTYSDHRLILQRLPKFRRRILGVSRHSNPLKAHISKVKWSDFASKIKVTYDRGYVDSAGNESLPQNVINVQINLINKILRNLKEEQNVQAIQPDEVTNYVETEGIMTEDITDIMDEMTALGSPVIAI